LTILLEPDRVELYKDHKGYNLEIWRKKNKEGDFYIEDIIYWWNHDGMYATFYGTQQEVFTLKESGHEPSEWDFNDKRLINKDKVIPVLDLGNLVKLIPKTF